MGYTNSTKNLGLPQWLDTDMPNWDIDTNEAFKKIDDYVGDTKTELDQMTADISMGQTDVDTINTALQAIDDAQKVQDDRIVAVEGQATSLQTNVTKLNNDYQTLGTKVDGLETSNQTLSDSVDAMQAQVNLNTTNITQAQGEIDANTGDISAIQADLGDWSATYPSDTVTAKMTEALAGGGGGNGKIKIVEFTIYDSQSRHDIVIPDYNGENVLVLGGYCTTAVQKTVQGDVTSAGAYPVVLPCYNPLPFKSAFENKDSNVTFSEGVNCNRLYVNGAALGLSGTGESQVNRGFNINVDFWEYSATNHLRCVSGTNVFKYIDGTKGQDSGGWAWHAANTNVTAVRVQALLIPDDTSIAVAASNGVTLDQIMALLGDYLKTADLTNELNKLVTPYGLNSFADMVGAVNRAKTQINNYIKPSVDTLLDSTIPNIRTSMTEYQQKNDAMVGYLRHMGYQVPELMSTTGGGGSKPKLNSVKIQSVRGETLTFAIPKGTWTYAIAPNGEYLALGPEATTNVSAVINGINVTLAPQQSLNNDFRQMQVIATPPDGKDIAFIDLACTSVI